MGWVAYHDGRSGNYLQTFLSWWPAVGLCHLERTLANYTRCAFHRNLPKFEGSWGYVSHLHPSVDGHHPGRLWQIGPGMHFLEIDVHLMGLGNMLALSILGYMNIIPVDFGKLYQTYVGGKLTSFPEILVILPTLVAFCRQTSSWWTWANSTRPVFSGN